MGITNCVANLPGFMAPSFVGWVVQDGHTLQNWGIVFVTTSAIFVISGTVFNLFCTAELQPWGSNAPTSNVNNDAVTMDNTRPEPDRSSVQMCKEDSTFDLFFQNHTEFTWDFKTQQLILNSFFYGLSLSQIPAGFSSDVYGGKWPFGISVLVTAIICLLIPTAARTSTGALISLRVVQGMAA
ncbi:unnamed protein product, partial [Larinioides sclopetarius]